MVSSGKFDLPSSSPDRTFLYNSGQFGSHSAALMENPILSSLPNMSRNTSTVSRLDVNSFLQCLRFDPKSMAAEYKYNRHGDFKRLANAALGAPDDLPSGSFKGKLPSCSPEDLKRMKVGLRESAVKARERVKIFSELLSVINKCFPSIPSRKRSRPDAFSGDRTKGLLIVGKMGTSAFDYEQHKVEDRVKSAIPNKRTRTSMVDQRADVRPNTPARSSGTLDSDREVLRLPNGNNALQSEDRALPIVADGWEKGKMKKKRSVIKADAAPSLTSVSAKPIDGCREPKQGVHSRNLPDARSRLNDSHAFRPGAANGIIGAGKADGIRSSIPRPELQSTSSLHDKRDQTTNSEQERTNLKSLNKASARDEFISGSPSSNTKLHARGPRSGLGVTPKLSPLVQRATASNGWESVHGSNRKRTLSTRSSSPPVAQWADRRPQKISRTARRTNLVPIVSNNDEITTLGNETVCEKGRGFTRRFPPNPAKQFKSKGDHLRDKGKNVQKMSTFERSTRKNKLANEEDLVDGVRRQGRAVRGFASSRIVKPTAKQLRTARLGFDKPERSFRLPTRKLPGRKAYTRQKNYAINVATDFLDDGKEELLVAAKEVINPSNALSSPFWMQIDQLFGFLSDADVSYIKQEGSKLSNVTTANLIDSCDTLPNRVMAFEPPKSGTEIRNSELKSEHLTSGTSLCQRLLAALISEEGNDEPTWDGSHNLEYNVYGSSLNLETDVESNAFNYGSFKNFEHGGRGTSNCYYRINTALRSCEDNHVMSIPDSAITTGFDPSMIPSITCSEYEYGNMSIDERLLLEIQSLGLYPARVPDLVNTGDEDVSEDISRLEEKQREQVSKKKCLLDKLLKSTEEARELHEKEFEQLSLDNLTGLAYQKYMGYWGPSAPGGKSASGKMAKQAALDFVKRTLERCQEFESTGKSCFAEPLFREMLLAGSSYLNDAQVDIDGNSEEKASGSQISPSLNNHDAHPSNTIVNDNVIWSIKVKKRELYLEDVAKGKRSEREVISRNGTLKIGRPSSANNIKGERKTKTKPKQKASKISDQNKTILSEDERKLFENTEELEPPLDFSHLQIPDLDDFGGQGQDIGSWLNIGDDILQDDDIMGLEIPMDDLSGLNMNMIV